MILALAVAAQDPGLVQWLCRPGRDDACASDLDATVVTRDARMRIERADRRRPTDVDCFYVYPTVSLDPGGNSDLAPGREEIGMTQAQFAPFRSVCRPFAPIYRQVTLTALRVAMRGGTTTADRELAYADVRTAWRAYLAQDNGGRPFVLVGHSQGALLLKRLLAEEIDGRPVQRRLLSAILPGTAVLVPEGRDVGGDLKTIPLCRRAGQTGCVVTWATYRAGPASVPKALFGGSTVAGMQAGCTNPAGLSGGAAPLDPILGFPWWRGGVARYARPSPGWTVGTRFVRLPGRLSGECVVRGGFSYLSVAVTPGAATALQDAVLGPEAVGDRDYPDWGFHVIDMAVVQGDLLRLVRRQRKAWRARN